MSASSWPWNRPFSILRIHQHSYWNKFVNQNRVQILLRQEWLTACHFRSTSSISGPVQVWDVCLSICLSVCVTGCLFATVSVCLSGFLYPDGLGTLPALCHMISLEAAGVKLIWSGLKAYKRLMLRINCSHLNSPFPPLKCPSCPCSAPNLLILTNGEQNCYIQSSSVRERLHTMNT